MSSDSSERAVSTLPESGSHSDASEGRCEVCGRGSSDWGDDETDAPTARAERRLHDVRIERTTKRRTYGDLPDTGPTVPLYTGSIEEAVEVYELLEKLFESEEDYVER